MVNFNIWLKILQGGVNILSGSISCWAQDIEPLRIDHWVQNIEPLRQHIDVFPPGANGILVLAGHNAGNLVDVGKVVHRPGT